MTHRVVCAAPVRDGRVLLGHRSPGRRWYPDVWDLPGGHVDDGETPARPPDAVLTADGLHLSAWVVRTWDGEVVKPRPTSTTSCAGSTRPAWTRCPWRIPAIAPGSPAGWPGVDARRRCR